MRPENSSDRTQCPSLWVTHSEGQHNKHPTARTVPEKLGEVGGRVLLGLLPRPVQSKETADWRRNIWGWAGTRWGRSWELSGTLTVGILEDYLGDCNWNELLPDDH